ncbi:hypothetical protein [Sphingomonas sp. 1P08PE]|uniref:hypothetical protein n=1 Tax=Sphingomonas sp. 1P08PE TaxID=554122 RepID=UPI0039A2D0ED
MTLLYYGLRYMMAEYAYAAFRGPTTYSIRLNERAAFWYQKWIDATAPDREKGA